MLRAPGVDKLAILLSALLLSGAVAAADLLLDMGDAEDLIAAEAGAVAHMNEDHADAVSIYATALAGEEPGPWRLSGVDPEGFDLTAGDRTARVLFPERVTSGDMLHRTLVRMVREARGSRTG